MERCVLGRQEKLLEVQNLSELFARGLIKLPIRDIMSKRSCIFNCLIPRPIDGLSKVATLIPPTGQGPVQRPYVTCREQGPLLAPAFSFSGDLAKLNPKYYLYYL